MVRFRQLSWLLPALACLLLCQCRKEPVDPVPGPSPESDLESRLPVSQILRNVSVTTDKAVYAPGSVVRFTGDRSQGGLGIRYWHLGDVVEEGLLEDSAEWTWTLPSTDFQGYMVELIGKNAEGVVRTVGTVAVDASSDWTRFPRYGFLSKFGNVAPSKRESVIANLNRYHINGLQYYDWMYDHHHPLAGTPDNPDLDWPSIIGDLCEKDVVQGYIEEAHKYNMASMFYDLCYGVLEWAEEDGVSPSWFIYKDSSHRNRDYHPLSAPFRSNIYLVNPGHEGWLGYFADRVDEVYQVFDFDGFHIDQLGNRGDRYGADGKKVDMPAGYGKFLEKMKQSRPDRKLAFNAVSRYGQAKIAAAPSDFLYNEVWTTGFSEIDKIMEENKSLAPDKNTVLAAYMNYKQSGTFNTPAVLLADAVIFALGGSHLELGEHMLSNEYFPSANLKMSSELSDKLVSYYDFLTGYENLLRDGAVRIGLNVSSDDVKMAQWGPEKGSVNTVAFQVGNKLVVHLLNFENAKHLDWRDDSMDQTKPSTHENLDISIRSSRDVKRVWVASPDVDGGAPREASFSASGISVKIRVPSLTYWTMIVIE
ncbi:MAG: glycoside hydrolase family 66 protein [Bacteroidales bacterium]|nr:glycoside hydrolase family 66 protein [Bacteroidales bacterium]